MAHSGDIHFGDIDFGGLCLNGHDVPKGARYCPACGSPATPPTGAADLAPAPVWTPSPPAPVWYRAPRYPWDQYSGGPYSGGPYSGPRYNRPWWTPPRPGWGPPRPRWGAPGYGPPPGYPAAGGYGWSRRGHPAGPLNGAAVAALVLGVAGFLGLFGIGSLAAVICGHIGVNQTARRGQRGHGAAVAGLVLGYLGLAFAVFVVAVAAASL